LGSIPAAFSQAINAATERQLVLGLIPSACFGLDSSNLRPGLIEADSSIWTNSVPFGLDSSSLSPAMNAAF
jgi:hypothetical protein